MKKIKKIKIIVTFLISIKFIALINGCSKFNEVEIDNTLENEVVKIVSIGDSTTKICKEISEEASKITQEKFGVDVELVRLPYESFVSKINLMLSSEEKIDLIPNFRMEVSIYANSGKILPLDDLLSEYGEGILGELTKEELQCVTVNGQIYAVPNNKEKAEGIGIAMRTDMLLATGIDPDSIKSEDDLDKLFAKVKELYPNTYPLVSDSGSMGYLMVTNDSLGVNFGVLENCLDYKNTEIVNFFETDTYKKAIEKRYEWAQKEYIMPDASINTIPAANLISIGKGFAYFTNVKPGIETEWTEKVGKEMTVIQMVEPYVTTSNVSNQWFIPNTSTIPEKAMQVLNEMYTNPYLSNLFINGIEGENYKVVDEEVKLIGYPEGTDALNTSYSSIPWVWPNELISLPWEYDGAYIWQETIEFNKEAKRSLGMGFLFDSYNVMSEIINCYRVTTKYVNALECGSLEPDETINRMNKELREAGIDKIIEEKKKQFSKWLNEHNKIN